jgi:hypothetical protein
MCRYRLRERIRVAAQGYGDRLWIRHCRISHSESGKRGGRRTCRDNDWVFRCVCDRYCHDGPSLDAVNVRSRDANYYYRAKGALIWIKAACSRFRRSSHGRGAYACDPRKHTQRHVMVVSGLRFALLSAYSLSELTHLPSTCLAFFATKFMSGPRPAAVILLAHGPQ